MSIIQIFFLVVKSFYRDRNGSTQLETYYFSGNIITSIVLC